MIDDMVMSHDIAESLFSPNLKKNAILDRTHLWRNKTVYYYIGNEYFDNHKEVIRDGIQLIRDATCVKFVELRHPSQAPGTYVHISSRKGCYARIGSKCKNDVCEMSLQIPVRILLLNWGGLKMLFGFHWSFNYLKSIESGLMNGSEIPKRGLIP